MVFHWSLSDSKYPQVSRNHLSILANLGNTVVWMASTHPSIFNSSSILTKPSRTVPGTPITIGIIITFMFHSFFNPLARSKYLSLFSFSLIFTLWSTEMAKSTIQQVLFFLLSIIRFCLLARSRWSVWITELQRIFHISFFMINSGLCIYHLVVWSDLNFLHNSQ